jgi:ABC-type phosphate transport system substrate-binding protein
MCKFSRARMVALAVGLGVTGSLAMAGSAMATVVAPLGEPLAGTDCAANATAASGSAVASASGKITGRGATLPLYLVTQYIHGFERDVCGPVAADSAANPYTPPAGFGEPTGDPTDPSNPVDGKAGGLPQPTYGADEMVGYDYPAAQDTSATGSGQGRIALSCRTDAFGGSDIPYNHTDFTKIDGAPGTEAGGLGSCLKTGFVSPFQSTGAATDPAGNMITLPIGGGAVAFVVNLPTACQNTATGTTPYQFTTADIAALMSGNQASWASLDTTNDPNLTAANGCDIPVTRVVRQDNSGTSQNEENYLGDANGTGVQLCGSGTVTDSGGNSLPMGTFADLKAEIINSEGFAGSNASENNVWPSGAGSGGRANCNTLATGASSGTPALLAKCVATSGCIGYGDLSDAVHDPGDLANLALPQVASSTGGFTTPNKSDGSSNCTYAAATLPGSSADNLMGKNGEWGIDGGAFGNHTDVAWTAQGSSWPACALTWEFAFQGDNGNSTVSPSGNQGFFAVPTNLTAAVPAGAIAAPLQVNKTSNQVFTNEVLTIATPGSGGTSTQVTVTANAAAGATSISVSGTAPAGGFPVGSAVATQTLNLASLPAGTPSTGKFLVTAGGVLQEATYAGTSAAPAQLTGISLGFAGNVAAASAHVSLPNGTGGPEPELSPNQRKTLYSYLSYVLSDAAQGQAAGAGFAQMPETWISLLRGAFQSDY